MSVNWGQWYQWHLVEKRCICTVQLWSFPSFLSLIFMFIWNVWKQTIIYYEYILFCSINVLNLYSHNCSDYNAGPFTGLAHWIYSGHVIKWLGVKRVKVARVHQHSSDSLTLFASHPDNPCFDLTEELLYLVQFDGLLNCEYASAPDSCLAQSEMWWMGRRARGHMEMTGHERKGKICAPLFHQSPNHTQAIAPFPFIVSASNLTVSAALFPINQYLCGETSGT